MRPATEVATLVKTMIVLRLVDGSLPHRTPRRRKSFGSPWMSSRRLGRKHYSLTRQLNAESGHLKC